MENEVKLQSQYEIQRLSKGGSSSFIHDTILDCIRTFLESEKAPQAIDLGCGAGGFTGKLSGLVGGKNTIGADLIDYNQGSPREFSFKKVDLSDDFSRGFGSKFNLITAVEVIEHMNDPWKFVKNLLELLASGGNAIISTPNPESLTSIISFAVRGYHSAFSPIGSPEHKLAIGEKDLQKIIRFYKPSVKTKVYYIPNGRLPGTTIHWNSVIPIIKGKRFSDNYFIHIKNE